MEDTIRTFIAIKIIPEEKLVTFFRKVKKEFSDESIKWVDENNFHLTLRFLGETSKEQVEKVNRSLEKIAHQTENFSIKLSGVGYFKNKRMPKVLFINIREIQNLKNITGFIEAEVGRAAFELENKAFNPHLTLGRIKFLKNRDKFIQLVNDWKEVEFQTINVNEVIFYQSILSSREPVYKPLGKFELK